MITTNIDTLRQYIMDGDRAHVSEYICRNRLIIYSVSCDGDAALFDSLYKAKIYARKLCKTRAKNVSVISHDPFETWREYISVYYYPRRLKWYYLHVDSLKVKKI